MDQRVEPMEVEEALTDAYNFDDIIDSELKQNDSKRLDPREVLTVSIILALILFLHLLYGSPVDTVNT